MHAPLGVPERQLELISALEACHARGLLHKFLGGCNDQKKALGACLRQERIERTTRNREDAKVRTARKQEVWAELEREG